MGCPAATLLYLLRSAGTRGAWTNARTTSVLSRRVFKTPISVESFNVPMLHRADLQKRFNRCSTLMLVESPHRSIAGHWKHETFILSMHLQMFNLNARFAVKPTVFKCVLGEDLSKWFRFGMALIPVFREGKGFRARCLENSFPDVRVRSSDQEAVLSFLRDFGC